MASGIYKLCWANCEYFYFGQAQDLNRRKNDHLASLARGKHRNKKLQAVFNKYGIPKIEIIEYCEIEYLDLKEEAIINIHFENTFCCNLKPSAKTMRGYRHTQDSKDRISATQKNKIISEETRRRHSAANKRRIIDGYVQAFSNETRKKMSDNHRLEKHSKAKLVVNTKTGVIYECAKIVSILFNINYSTLRDYLKNRRPNKTPFIYVK